MNHELGPERLVTPPTETQPAQALTERGLQPALGQNSQQEKETNPPTAPLTPSGMTEEKPAEGGTKNRPMRITTTEVRE